MNDWWNSTDPTWVTYTIVWTTNTTNPVPAWPSADADQAAMLRTLAEIHDLPEAE